MLGAIYVIVINIVTDMVPYFSILELKFIEIYSSTKNNRAKSNENAEDNSNNFASSNGSPKNDARLLSPRNNNNRPRPIDEENNNHPNPNNVISTGLNNISNDMIFGNQLDNRGSLDKQQIKGLLQPHL
jgi:hypothetical protein